MGRRILLVLPPTEASWITNHGMPIGVRLRMGFSIAVVDADDHVLEIIHDPRQRLNPLFGIADDFIFFKHIDPYGNTVFNRPQMDPLLVELRGLAERTDDPEAEAILGSIIRMATRVSHEVHLYLKFFGD